MQLLWILVTYLLKNVKHGIEHDIDSAHEFAYIRHSWILQQTWWIPCTLRKWWVSQSDSL